MAHALRMTVDPRLSRREFIVLSALGLAGFFALWTLLAASGLVPKLFLPSPFAVATGARSTAR